MKKLSQKQKSTIFLVTGIFLSLIFLGIFFEIVEELEQSLEAFDFLITDLATSIPLLTEFMQYITILAN